MQCIQSMAVDLDRFSAVLPSPVPAPVAPIPTQADVVIVGGGIVGAMLACSLLDSNLSVVVLEAKPLESGLANRRAYALTLLSADIFQGLGLWKSLRPQMMHFTQIALSDGNYPAIVKFLPQDMQRSDLGYVAEHRVILQGLYDRLRQGNNITWLAPAQVNRVHYPPSDSSQTQAVVELTLPNAETLQIQTPLVVAADGANSPLRQAAGIPTWGWKYWQSCIGFTVKSDRPHDYIAYEKFCASGPFALLPLPDQRCQVVWTAPHSEAQALAQLSEPDFLDALTQRYGTHGGALQLETPRQVFPVRLMQGKRYVQHRLALVGDAAHCCHPVGGQGMNLGIRDAVALAEVILEAQQRGEDWGSLRVLQQYDRWRRWENGVILGFTDFLDRCFSNELWPIVILRRMGIQGLIHIPPLRYLALRLMTGQWGRKPKIAQSARLLREAEKH